MDSILQHVLTTIGQQHLLLGYAVNLTDAHADNTLLTLVIDTGIEAQILRIEVLNGLYHFLAGLKVKFISIKKIHFIRNFKLFFLNHKVLQESTA